MYSAAFRTSRAVALAAALCVLALLALASAPATGPDLPPARPDATATPTPTRRRAPPTTAAPTTSTTASVPMTSVTVPAGSVLAVGDSVMLDAAALLRRDGFEVDAAVGRQFDAGVTLLDAARRAGRLPGEVVVHLGTNGPITPAQLDQLMAAVAGRRVVLVTLREPRFWETASNDALRGAAARWPGVRLADWHAAGNSGDTGGWFYGDGIHLTPAGASAYARVIEAAV